MISWSSVHISKNSVVIVDWGLNQLCFVYLCMCMCMYKYEQNSFIRCSFGLWMLNKTFSISYYSVLSKPFALVYESNIPSCLSSVCSLCSLFQIMMELIPNKMSSTFFLGNKNYSFSLNWKWNYLSNEWVVIIISHVKLEICSGIF